MDFCYYVLNNDYHIDLRLYLRDEVLEISLGSIHAVPVHNSKRKHSCTSCWSILGGDTFSLRALTVPGLFHRCDHFSVLLRIQPDLLAIRLQILGHFDRDSLHD